MPEIVAPKPEATKTVINVTGTFECHTCYDWVWEATYFPSDKKLGWTCDAGHYSEIEYHLAG